MGGVLRTNSIRAMRRWLFNILSRSTRKLTSFSHIYLFTLCTGQMIREFVSLLIDNATEVNWRVLHSTGKVSISDVWQLLQRKDATYAYHLQRNWHPKLWEKVIFQTMANKANRWRRSGGIYGQGEERLLLMRVAPADPAFKHAPLRSELVVTWEAPKQNRLWPMHCCGGSSCKVGGITEGEV